MATASGVVWKLYEETFTVKEKDPDGKKFDKVSRFRCFGSPDAELLLDVNIDVYPLVINQMYNLVLASTLSLDGTADDGAFEQSGKPSLMDKYEYVMYGKVFRINDDKATVAGVARVCALILSQLLAILEVLASFGGLLMSLKGDLSNLSRLETDKRLYLLLKKA